MSSNYVGKMLGHANVSTTNRYLNIQRRGLHLAMEQLEEHQRTSESVAQTSHTESETARRGYSAAPAFSLISALSS